MQSLGNRKLYPEDCTTCDTALDLKNRYPAGSIGFVPPVPGSASSGGGGASFDGNVSTDSLVTIPDGEDIPNNSTYTFPVAQVRTFTVVREGNGDVTVDFGNGRTITLDRNGTRSWGTGDGAGLIDVSGITITTTNSNAEVTWENV